MHGGVHRYHRAMTSGFERTPFLLEPRNPRRVPAQFLAAGFAPVHRWRSYDLGRAAFGPLHATLAALARRRAGGLEIAWVDPRDPAAALARLHPLLEAVWAGHPGWIPISLEEFAASFGAMLPLLPPRHLAVLTDERGRDVGMGFMYPDWADEVRALGGDASGWGRWMGRARARRVVAHTVAVRPEIRNRAAGAKLIAKALEVSLEDGYEELVFPITTERFRFWDHRLPATREYALYGRTL
jgi:GNAT superfamily N-acetyltransferase